MSANLILSAKLVLSKQKSLLGGFLLILANHTYQRIVAIIFDDSRLHLT